MRELECWRPQLISWRLNSTLYLPLFSDESLDEEDEGAGVLEATADDLLKAEHHFIFLFSQMRVWMRRMRGQECWRPQLTSWRLNSTLNLVLFSDESLDEEDEGSGVLEDTANDQLETELHS